MRAQPGVREELAAAHVLIEHNVQTATYLSLRRQVQAYQDRLAESSTREEALHWSIRFGAKPSTLEIREQGADLTVQEPHSLNAGIGG